MDVVIRIIWWVELDNPVNFREVKTSLSDICAKKDTCIGLAEFKVSRSAFLLLLLSVNVLHLDVYIVEQIRIKLDSVARGHEYHYLLLEVLFQEGE